MNDWIENEVYYAIGVMPKRKLQLRHSLVVNFRCIGTLLEDNDLREYWGYYLEDLLDSFDLPTVESDALDAEDFFRKYGKLLLDACCYCYIDPGERKMRWESENYRKVAMAHRLTVSKGRIPEAISNLSAALTAIVCME